IRVSGENSLELTDKIFKGKNKLSDFASHTIHYGNILDSKNEIIDDVLVSVFKSPNSYTGENSVEVSSHGSQLICNKILERLVEVGVRLAEPGEFTKRAFLNGRIDLSQAEAVIDIINSRTNASLKGARNQLDGVLSNKVDELRNSLLNSSSLIELELDFAEEDLEFVSYQKVREEIQEIISVLAELIESYKYGKIIREGLNVVLVGKPNVGKSSLLNYLVKEARAIVSHIPGTTRDVLREELSVDGILIKLYDTAGIRFTEDEIEKEGVLRSRKAVKDADLVVLISEALEEFPKGLYEELLTLTEEKNIIHVENKCDLKTDKSKFTGIPISAKTGEGIERFLKEIKVKGISSDAYSEKTILVTNLRHKNALEKAKEYLVKSIESIDQKFTGEFISVDLRNAESALGEIIGIVTTDDILNNIFAKFCIGK
ncbi:MAG: tRNA uridine-5-carboxymethylaminomethyl(34) synthesis GTPase MnmE, partial [Ignavibacteriales bacterium]|nr:tRNA uridine-5-carboxymethylaminomethyl(34) synthesis GTPase MnmE [Ignavibacteriales bacterium]